MKFISIPTLLIHALDDPICIKEMIPFVEAYDNKNIFMLITKKGGHINFFTGEKQPKRWAYKPTIEFLTYQAKLNGDMKQEI